jgi:hypothetical protein
MVTSRFGLVAPSAGLLLFALAPLAAAAAPDSAGIEFFEKKIRPLFVEHCYKCHSVQAEKLKGGLLLDTREGLLKGGDTGPAIVPGDPEKSLLIKAVRYTDENLQMPPKNQKLMPEQIADLELWVKMGAHDPRTGKPEAPMAKHETQKHWAFQPIRQPSLPSVKNKRWVQSPVDVFILAKLEERQINPNPLADKRTLIRRAAFDLIGLPPTQQEVNDFMADKSPEAFAKVIERLLDSPRYGERWGRYWLDIARYADTKGYVFEEERRYPYAYTYRDYVIRSWNEDLPFDQFIVQQIAADLLPLGEDKRPLAALGFLTLGRRFLNNQPDIIDDRIDVVTRGTMGLTVTCARCHDHKYDPIPTRDYYSLYGVFASSHEPREKPLLGNAAMPREYPEYLAERDKREDELEKFRQTKEAEVRRKLRSQVGDYLLAVHDAAQLEDQSKAEGLVRQRKLDPGVMGRWKESLDKWSKSPHPIFAPWIAFAALPEKEFEAKANEVAAPFAAKGEGTNGLNPWVARAFREAPSSLKQVAERYNQLFADIDKQWTELLEAYAKTNSTTSGPNSASMPGAFADSDQEALRQVLYAPEAPPNVDFDSLRRLLDTPAQQKLRALRRKVEELDATHPGSPPRAMALADNSTPYNPHVFVRGNANNPGPEVPRQFLEVLAGEKRQPFQKGSGRLELAQAVASTNNPLTARVIVNRVWMYHFGTALVKTPSDFGLRSEPPTHPELLDWLASQFMADGWSLKKLHRRVMLSSAYQQSSENNAQAARIDPNNQLLWKMNRRRLDFEAMRDTLLAVAGQMDLTAGGRPLDLTTDPFTTRRTIYGFVERQNLPGLFRTFDFASPDTTSPQRFSTTVPQQALFLMNSPFVVEQARQLVEQPDIKSRASDLERIQGLYQVAYQRNPEADEVRFATQFIQQQASASGVSSAAPVWQYGWGVFDEKTSRVKAFHRLPYFTKYAWQGSTNLPDPELGWVLLSAEGGHPGNDQQHAAIRRWTAPSDGVVNIDGELHHPQDKGDGVRGRIVSSAKGLAGEWEAYHQKRPTKVEQLEIKRGDTLDFVVDCQGSVEYDTFNWTPTVKYISSGGGLTSGQPREWNAKTDFSGPPKEKPKSLGAWEKLAQVLLLSNEFFFVD